MDANVFFKESEREVAGSSEGPSAPLPGLLGDGRPTPGGSSDRKAKKNARRTRMREHRRGEESSRERDVDEVEAAPAEDFHDREGAQAYLAAYRKQKAVERREEQRRREQEVYDKLEAKKKEVKEGVGRKRAAEQEVDQLEKELEECRRSAWEMRHKQDSGERQAAALAPSTSREMDRRCVSGDRRSAAPRASSSAKSASQQQQQQQPPLPRRQQQSTSLPRPATQRRESRSPPRQQQQQQHRQSRQPPRPSSSSTTPTPRGRGQQRQPQQQQPRQQPQQPQQQVQRRQQQQPTDLQEAYQASLWEWVNTMEESRRRREDGQRDSVTEIAREVGRQLAPIMKKFRAAMRGTSSEEATQ